LDLAPLTSLTTVGRIITIAENPKLRDLTGLEKLTVAPKELAAITEVLKQSSCAPRAPIGHTSSDICRSKMSGLSPTLKTCSIPKASK
jgi:hypothetical protein